MAQEGETKITTSKLAKCVNRNEKLDVMLGKQKCSLDKVGIGYNLFLKRKFPKNKFNTLAEKTQITCFYYQKKGYIASQYFSIQKSHARPISLLIFVA